MTKKTTAEELAMLIEIFERDNGRPPELNDIMQMREAIASVALDKGDDVGTHSVDTVVVSEGGAYTAHYPTEEPTERPTYTESDVREAQRVAYEKGKSDGYSGSLEGNPYE